MHKRNKILLGAKKLHDYVTPTMGPKGHNVLIRSKFGELHVTHDGFTVAKSVQDEDKDIQNGIDLFRLGSKNMDSTIADGTSSVLSLSYNLAKHLSKKASFTNPMVLKQRLEDELPKLLAQVDTMTIPIKEQEEDILNIARISAEDETIARNVTDVIIGTGYQGAVTVDTMQNAEDTIELVDGYVVQDGYVSAHFVTNPESKESSLSNTAVLLINGRIENLKYYIAYLNEIIEAGYESVLFICNDIDNEVLNTLIYNRLKGGIPTCVVKNTHGYEYLEDIQAVTGAEIYSPSLSNEGPSLKNTGKASLVTGKETETIIVGGFANTEQHLKALKKLQKNTPTPELEKRLSLLTGRVGHIVVGGLTDVEAKEKKDRYDDAIGAARAALKGGIVPGGGTALAHLKTDYAPLKKALKAPYFQLMKNSGIRKWRFNHTYLKGMDVMSGKEVDLLEAGIIDPSDRIKEELKTAISIVSTYITVSASINEKEYTQEQIDKMLKM